jgi:hypothetical protein
MAALNERRNESQRASTAFALNLILSFPLGWRLFTDNEFRDFAKNIDQGTSMPDGLGGAKLSPQN